MNWKKCLRKLTNKKVMVSLFLAGIMIFSMFGFIMSYGSEEKRKEEYNGFEFEFLGSGIQTTVNNKKIQFDYLPGSLEDIEMPDLIANNLQNIKMIRVTYDPDSIYAETMAQIQYDLSEKLDDINLIYVERGITKKTEYELPQLTCENVTSFIPVLELKKSNKTKISFEEGCIIAEANIETDFYRLKDRIVYAVAGIMN